MRIRLIQPYSKVHIILKTVLGNIQQSKYAGINFNLFETKLSDSILIKS